MSISVYLANAMIDHILGTAEFVAPANLYVGLFTGNPDTNPETEISTVGTGYARVLVTFGTPSNAVAEAIGDIIFGEALTDNEIISYLGIFDAETEGNLLFFDQVVAFDYEIGTAPRILEGNLNISFWGTAPIMGNSYLKHILNQTTFTQPSTIYISLHYDSGISISTDQVERKQIKFAPAAEGAALNIEIAPSPDDNLYLTTLPDKSGLLGKIKYLGLWRNETGDGIGNCLFLIELSPWLDYYSYSTMEIKPNDLEIKFVTG